MIPASLLYQQQSIVFIVSFISIFLLAPEEGLGKFV